MAAAKKRLTELFFKYLEIFGLIAFGMFLGWLLLGNPARASSGEVMYNKAVKEDNMDCQDCEDNYPLKLSFVCPITEVKFERVMNDEGQADDVFHWFFSKWGYEVPYCVDEVKEVPGVTILRRHSES